eukprot:IDg1953t1
MFSSVTDALRKHCVFDLSQSKAQACSIVRRPNSFRYCFARAQLRCNAVALQRTFVANFLVLLAEHAEGQIVDAWIVSSGQVVTVFRLEIVHSS